MVVHPHNKDFPHVQYEAARYYLEPRITVQLATDDFDFRGEPGAAVYHAHCVSDGWLTNREKILARFYGLAVTISEDIDSRRGN